MHGLQGNIQGTHLRKSTVKSDPIRKRIWEILETAKDKDRVSRAFDLLISTLILLSIVAIILESIPELRQTHERWFFAIEVFVVAFFTIEYLARAWACVQDSKFSSPLAGRLRYLRTPFAIVDLLAILPFYLLLLGVDFRFLRLLRLMRLLRIFKLGRYYRAMEVIGAVIKSKKEELILASCVMGVLLLFASCLMYFLESAAQPEAFSSIPAAMWWSIVTLTTVGYGDIYPVTALGRLFGSFIALSGVGMVALPTGILGAGFVEIVQKKKRPAATCPRCGEPL